MIKEFRSKPLMAVRDAEFHEQTRSNRVRYFLILTDSVFPKDMFCDVTYDLGLQCFLQACLSDYAG